MMDLVNHNEVDTSEVNHDDCNGDDGTYLQHVNESTGKWKKLKNKHGQITTLALWMTLGTFVIFLIAIGLTHTVYRTNTNTINHDDDGSWKKTVLTRRLDDGADNDNSGDTDFTTYSCDKIFSLTEVNTEARCNFAKTCNDNSGIYLSSIFCTDANSHFTTYQLFGILSPFLLVWLITLFRMLGTTAEDFFSPSLEMFSVKMGLPPRFAGVSLLALGNGAADVSATMSAIVSDPNQGYQMSLGALTGAAMFIGTIVAASVIITAGGIPCRGALVRDICMFIITLLVVYFYLLSGEIGHGAITTFFSLYIVFVVIVLIADIYHRSMVVPRIKLEREEAERVRQYEEGRKAQEAAGVALNAIASNEQINVQNNNHNNDDDDDNQWMDETHTNVQPVKNKALNSILTSLSNYNYNSSRQLNATPNGWGISGDQLEDEKPVILHGPNGVLNKRNMGSPFRGENQIDQQQGHHTPTSPYTAMQDEPDDMDVHYLDALCTANGFPQSSAYNWTCAWQDGKEELKLHFINFKEDLLYNEENNKLDKFLLLCELPFSLLRKLTVPLPCDGHYCRALVSLSTLLSPIWLGIYAYRNFDSNLFFTGGFPYIEISTVIAFIVAALVLRFSPAEDGAMSMYISAPIALYGFVVAASWIDTIADQLVDLLNFLGIVCHIPNSVMGITILAWGNSMGDLSADVIMAKKGLANMAITACYAGPVFNILFGLGAGFASLSSKTGQATKAVDLNPPIAVGFLFLLFNCILILAVGLFWQKGKISKNFGYSLFVLYSFYLVTSLLLEFGNKS